jgi:hypothetical protein
MGTKWFCEDHANIMEGDDIMDMYDLMYERSDHASNPQTTKEGEIPQETED